MKPRDNEEVKGSRTLEALTQRRRQLRAIADEHRAQHRSVLGVEPHPCRRFRPSRAGAHTLQSLGSPVLSGGKLATPCARRVANDTKTLRVCRRKRADALTEQIVRVGPHARIAI